jgi:hypothetical protein
MDLLIHPIYLSYHELPLVHPHIHFSRTLIMLFSTIQMHYFVFDTHYVTCNSSPLDLKLLSPNHLFHHIT